MTFTSKVTPSVYQLQRQLGAISNGVILESGKTGERFLNDAGVYTPVRISGYPGELRWFLLNEIPEKYLLLAGQTLNRYSYVDLFEAETVNIDITVSNEKTTTLLKYTIDSQYLKNGELVTIETSESFPIDTFDITKKYYVVNLNTTKKQFQLSLNEDLSDPIYISDLSGISGTQKIRLYPNEVISSGDNYSTFVLLDARGYFLRNDYMTRRIGNKQEDAFQGHMHFNTPFIYSVEGAGEFGGIGDYLRKYSLNSPGSYEYSSVENYGTPRIANETRSKNIAAHLCIRY